MLGFFGSGSASDFCSVDFIEVVLFLDRANYYLASCTEGTPLAPWWKHPAVPLFP